MSALGTLFLGHGEIPSIYKKVVVSYRCAVLSQGSDRVLEVADVSAWDNLFAGEDEGGAEGKEGEEESKADASDGDESDAAAKILSDHNSATKGLIEKLRKEQKNSHDKLKERLAAKRAKKLSELSSIGASEEEVKAAEAALEEEDIKERIQNDRMLTLDEHKAIEEYEFGQNGGALGVKLNTYELLDKVHSEFKEEREQLQQAMMEEKKRQKNELKRQRKERRAEKKRRQSLSSEIPNEEEEEEKKNDLSLESEVQRIMEEEKKEGRR